MAISGGDGSIILTTKVDESGLKKGMQQANKFAQMSTNEQRRMAQSLSKVYRQQGMSQSEAQKKAWQDLKNNTVATKDLAKATEDVAKKTEQATKETKEYGETAKRSGTVAKNTFLAVGKAFLTIGVASAAAIVAITKQAVSAYADYEQLVGGVETLFKGSAQKVIDYANDAFYTAGVSANEYMQQVTSFSASLIRSTAGDTDKAADVANMALVDISDNVNKMGSSMESVTLAYQGFAKQQYQLLDNLKLGYGGTKGEMERLLKDAQALTGVKYDINNLADVYSAIHAIQEELGITGTTAKEAEKTITGSANMMKAAWQNVLTAISGGGDLDRAINNLVDSISNYFENIVPVVERALSGIGRLIEKVAPMLVQTVAKSLIKAIPSLLNAVYEMIIGLAKGIYQGIIDLFNGTSREALMEQAENIEQSVENQNDLTKAVEETNEAMEKTTASFDTVEILSAGMAQNASAEPIIPEIDMGTSGKDDEEKPPILNNLGKFLENFKKEAKKYASLFEPTVNAWKESFEEVSGSIASSMSSIGDTAVGLRDNTLAPFGAYIAEEFVPNITNNFSENFAPIIADVSSWATQQLASDFEWAAQKIDAVVNDVVKPAMDTFSQIVTDTNDVIGQEWEESGQDILNGMTESSESIKSLWDNLYGEVLKPFWDSIISGISDLWENHLKGFWENCVSFFTSIWDFIMTLWNNVLSPLINWIIDVVGPVISSVFNNIVSVINTVIGIIADVVGGIMKALGGLLDFITGIFSGDWEKAWNGILQFFGGIWDAIWGVIKGVINLIIDALNGLWSGLYSVLAGIINGVGGIISGIGELLGQDWGWEVPTQAPLIPRLAQGTVVPPNKEFMAILGDNTNEHEIVSPISTMKQAFMEAMVEMGGNFSGGNTEVVLEIDGREFGRAVVEQGNRENRRIGTRLVVL